MSISGQLKLRRQQAIRQACNKQHQDMTMQQPHTLFRKMNVMMYTTKTASGNSAMRLPESCSSTDSHGAITVYSRELGCRFDRRFIRLKAASPVEAHRRQPHFIPVCVVAIGKRLLLPFRGSAPHLAER